MLKSLLSSSRRQLFFNLIIFNVVFSWTDSFSFSVLKPHFASEGLSIEQMILGTLYTFVGAGLLMLLINKISARLSWRLSFITSFLTILLIMRIASPAQFYLASVVSGLYIPLFYIAYNIAHYRLTPPHRTGYSSAIMFSIFPIVGLVAPLAAGWLAQIDYVYVWIFSGIFFLITFLLTKFQTDFPIKYDLAAGWQAIKATRVIVFLQGVWEALPFGIIPVFSLHFIKSPLYYGTYMAYLSLMSVIANLVLGQLSDRLQRRLAFLYPITLVMAGATFLFPLVTANLIFWLILTGIVQFLCPLFWNFSASWFVDQQPDHNRSMPIRELVLAVGRIVGLFFAWVSFRLETTPVYIFYALGTVMLLYPLVLLYNTRHAAKS
jgi:MFS family permease